MLQFQDHPGFFVGGIYAPNPTLFARKKYPMLECLKSLVLYYSLLLQPSFVLMVGPGRPPTASYIRVILAEIVSGTSTSGVKGAIKVAYKGKVRKVRQHS
jgi:hypothetical protein